MYIRFKLHIVTNEESETTAYTQPEKKKSESPGKKTNNWKRNFILLALISRHCAYVSLADLDNNLSFIFKLSESTDEKNMHALKKVTDMLRFSSCTEQHHSWC